MTDPYALAGVLEQLACVHVLVVGDVMLDRFVSGTVERISPEAPIPVLRIQSEYPMVGGAANVARNVSALGANAAIVGITGTEPAADEFGGLLAAIARLTSLVVKEPLRTTTVKTRYYGDQRQLLRADREVVVPLNAAAIERLCQAITGGAAKSNAIIVSDYAKGVVDAATFAAAVAAARKARIPLLVDPKGADLARYRGASVLTPNAGELAAATGMPVRDDPTAEAAARRAMELSGVPAVVATRGAAGITVVEQGKAPVHLRARAREVRDVSGAGDTVVAMLAAALAGARRSLPPRNSPTPPPPWWWARSVRRSPRPTRCAWRSIHPNCWRPTTRSSTSPPRWSACSAGAATARPSRSPTDVSTWCTLAMCRCWLRLAPLPTAWWWA